MKENFTTNIRISPLNRDKLDDLENVKTYLKRRGKCEYSSVDTDPKEYRYKVGDSSIFIREFTNRVNIDIISPTEPPLNRMRVNIGRVLEGKLI